MTEEEKDKIIYSNIEKYGCHILHIFEQENYPEFSYSIGIQKKTKQPELVISGLSGEVSKIIINDYNDRVKNGDIFEEDKFYDCFLENHNVTFKKVEKKFYDNHFGFGQWLYKGNDFNVLQLIWPSKLGKWPWDKDAEEGYLWLMPQLYKD